MKAPRALPVFAALCCCCLIAGYARAADVTPALVTSHAWCIIDTTGVYKDIFHPDGTVDVGIYAGGSLRTTKTGKWNVENGDTLIIDLGRPRSLPAEASEDGTRLLIRGSKVDACD